MSKRKVIDIEKVAFTRKNQSRNNHAAFMTTLISREAAEDLNIKVGEVEAVIKATEVMIAE